MDDLQQSSYAPVLRDITPQPVLQIPKDREGGRQFYKHVLVAKLVSDKRFSPIVLRNIYVRAWSLNNRLDVKEVGNNLFLLSFEDPDDRFRIMMETHWSMAGYHLVIKEWSSNKSLLEVDFSLSKCWVQCHGLCPSQLSKENGWLIGKLFESCFAVDMTDDNKLSYNSILRLRVLFNVHKPLVPDFFMLSLLACKLSFLPPCPPFTQGRFGLWMKAEAGFAKWLFSKIDWPRNQSESSTVPVSSVLGNPPASDHGGLSVHPLPSHVEDTVSKQVLARCVRESSTDAMQDSSMLTPGDCVPHYQPKQYDLSSNIAELFVLNHEAQPSLCDLPLIELRSTQFDSPRNSRLGSSSLHSF
ncbi:hypothetical protein Tsubulata_036581 [Turnera subulata]|uniref:DUF4283 domain-containing protein n=1 Tax=Turnera subulata TaxID=218843 RepID=A0A9Q0G875_9ROSI|nr:hypothetical protein Tsubulata_036581 [Turnera subulata]